MITTPAYPVTCVTSTDSLSLPISVQVDLTPLIIQALMVVSKAAICSSNGLFDEGLAGVKLT